MNHPELICDDPRRPAPIDTWAEEAMKRHGILTHFTVGIQEPWLAYWVQEEDSGKSIEEIAAESCRYYDEMGFAATGTTKGNAVEAVIKRNGLK